MIADEVATRIRAVTGLTVYEHAVPKTATPDRYVIVQSVTRVDSYDLSVGQVGRDHDFWVRTIATDRATGDEQVAVSRCAWAAEKADEALAGWRLNGWVASHTAASAARRDLDQPDRVVAYAASIWTVRST